MSKNGPVMAKAFEEPTTASFYFREKDKVQPKGYEGLVVDQEATIILKGTIRRVGCSAWEKGKGFEIEISSCEISGPPRVVTIDDAVTSAASSAKKVK